MKLIIFPLLFMVVFMFLAWGMDIAPVNSSGQITVMSGDTSQGWYDANDHQVADENNTATGESGLITFPVIQGGDGPWKNLPVWKNATSSYNVYDYKGTRVQADANQSLETSFDAASSIGLAALVALGIGLLGVVGFKFLGSGESEVSAKGIFMGTMLLAIWGFLSVSSMNLILAVPFFGGIFWFFLTFLYTIGSLQQMAGTTGDA